MHVSAHENTHTHKHTERQMHALTHTQTSLHFKLIISHPLDKSNKSHKRKIERLSETESERARQRRRRSGERLRSEGGGKMGEERDTNTNE